MKKAILTVTLMVSVLGASVANNNGTKKVKPIDNEVIEFNLSQFNKYLNDGNAREVEGIYSDTANRYQIAIVKNNEREHDYIGIVISSDNPYWKTGEIKFNFIKDGEHKLKGYYYNSKGDYVPVEFDTEAMRLGDVPLRKMETGLTINQQMPSIAKEDTL